MCVVAPGGVCVVTPGGGGGHAWLLWGACMVFSRGVRGFLGGMHRIRRDMVNERAVRILLECILVTFMI